ncbi:phosphotransferase family protein [Frankia sp. AgB1.9]|uniref:phosphotransferase family protein n=1 Tax=unclassified Frankia TaxID=2632575 RepID=UPI0019322821|nr:MULTISPECIES: phosphotransferase family protein [unclassified Frankia]MBL7487578.1 phosphotransferase family protein [Frankia sp. AgW1.1]MBL7548958.1 phosphotransferase family protein [Frankia sp. AgB1.9]MBL7620661.1 phosphotransferase family protein [Frankia sp. AgB1.8]
MAGAVTTERREPSRVRAVLEPWLAAHLGVGRLDRLTVEAPSGHGFSNDTLLVELVTNGERLDLVVQAAPTQAGLFPDYAIAEMFRLQRDLRDLSTVPVANVRWLEQDPRLLGAAFYAMDRVEGKVPDESPPYHRGGWVFDATADDRARMTQSLLTAMAALHRLDVAEHFPYLTSTRWGMALDADPAAERVRQWRDYTAWACDGDKPPAFLSDAWQVLGEALPERPERLSVAWGDAKLGNVIFRDFEVVALLDWELCGVGPAEEDLTNQLAVDRVLAGMGATPMPAFFCPDEVLTAYETLLGRPLVGTRWWYAFAVAKMAAEVHRILVQSRKLGARSGLGDLSRLNIAAPELRRALGLL